MAIDTSILTRARPLQLENPVNRMAQVLQIQGMQDQQKMNALKTQEYQDSLARKNKLMETLGGQYAKPEEREEALLRSGFVDEAAKLTKNRVDSLKVQADTDKNKVEAAHKRVAAWGQGMGFVRQAPTAENAVATVQHLVNMGVMPEEQGQRHLAQIQSDPSPQAIARWAEMGFRAALDTKEQLTKFQTNNIGGQTVTQGIDPVTGKASTVSAIQNTQSPDAVLQALTSEANNRRSVGAQYAIANATREAAKTTADATREAAATKDKRDTEMKLADDWRNQSKNFKEVSDAHKIIKASLKNATTSAAATLAGATKFMKLLDPGSVVRESELGMALAASGMLDRAMHYTNTLKNGKTLNPKQAADFENIADQIYQAAAQGQKVVDENYKRQAGQYGLRPDMIVQDLGQNASQPVSIDSLPSAGKPGKPRELQWR